MVFVGDDTAARMDVMKLHLHCNPLFPLIDRIVV